MYNHAIRRSTLVVQYNITQHLVTNYTTAVSSAVVVALRIFPSGCFKPLAVCADITIRFLFLPARTGITAGADGDNGRVVQVLGGEFCSKLYYSLLARGTRKFL